MTRQSTEYKKMDSYQKAEFIAREIVSKTENPNNYTTGLSLSKWMNKAHYFIRPADETDESIRIDMNSHKPHLTVLRLDGKLLHAIEITDCKIPFTIEHKFR